MHWTIGTMKLSVPKKKTAGAEAEATDSDMIMKCFGVRFHHGVEYVHNVTLHKVTICSGMPVSSFVYGLIGM
jgi:hypothetical protein